MKLTELKQERLTEYDASALKREYLQKKTQQQKDFVSQKMHSLSWMKKSLQKADLQQGSIEELLAEAFATGWWDGFQVGFNEAFKIARAEKSIKV